MKGKYEWNKVTNSWMPLISNDKEQIGEGEIINIKVLLFIFIILTLLTLGSILFVIWDLYFNRV